MPPGRHFVIQGGQLIAGGGDWTPRRADLEIDAGRITAIGPDLDAPSVFDARGKVVVPGFVNAHLHLGAQFFRFERIGAASRRLLTTRIGSTNRGLSLAG